MKKVRFIYNPYSGENSIISELDQYYKTTPRSRINSSAI